MTKTTGRVLLDVLPPMGLGNIRKLLESAWQLLKGEKKERVSPLTRERQSFEKEAKDQFLKLKEKGLSIPIFTL